MSQSLSLVSLLVDDYDQAIAFYTEKLGFELTALSGNTNSVLAQVAELNEKITKATATKRLKEIKNDTTEKEAVALLEKVVALFEKEAKAKKEVKERHFLKTKTITITKEVPKPVNRFGFLDLMGVLFLLFLGFWEV